MTDFLILLVLEAMMFMFCAGPFIVAGPDDYCWSRDYWKDRWFLFLFAFLAPILLFKLTGLCGIIINFCVLFASVEVD